ncbi:hypothetical protein [Aliiroseovarius marinus]|uniref:hypothetical protein n=1 Tax=Aliiroseovarius marinus TaxID=2500159 RepID=UPI002494E36C|nr:hypothetical protein [Aliiroseovarius marinus]
MDEHEHYKKVELGIEAFSQPFNDLEKLLRVIPDDELRKTTLRALGESMGSLELIAYEFRKHLGTTTL